MSIGLRVVEAVALDVGGVLYYDEPFELAWLQGVLERASEADPGLTIEIFARRTRDFYLRRTPAAESPGLFTPAGASSWEEVRRKWTALVQPIPGSLEALESIAACRPVCAVANQPPECAAALEEIGAVRHLRLVALDSTVGSAKPDPALFRWALDRLGWTPRTALVVGDRPDHDAAPAQELGCLTALVPPPAGWTVPPGVDAAVVNAYESVRRDRIRAREHPASTHSAHFASLAGVASALYDRSRSAASGSTGWTRRGQA